MVNKVVNRFDFKKDGVYKVPITYEEMDTLLFSTLNDAPFFTLNGANIA